ncbi:tyrosine-protein kinase transmembrane receptor Ror-like isoform X2 [Ruditapes philippinarum]|uniref:tyrosine-protein kinase transmembrane receptor Ror-like isoform X2 n=1 Tax=Ruditapes philippinarum TaxID=129788 RepID=UPI00295B11A2|nr:tyrosine-protein kinase transmembrane receptor Ror-like isoform X2 [Ruditapes philippinarum]
MNIPSLNGIKLKDFGLSLPENSSTLIRFQYTEEDLTDAVRCESNEDCPKGSNCPLQDIEMKNICFCVHTLKPVKNGTDCNEYTADQQDGKSGVIPISDTHHLKSPNQAKHPPDYRTSVDNSSMQTTSNVLMSHSGLDTFSDIALKVLLPVGSVLIISFVMLFIILSYRYFRGCHFRLGRKNKRGKNSAIVKASEDIQLLDKLNVVNRNPSYFGTNAEGYGKRWIINDIPVDNVRLQEVVGEGAFGQVYKGELVQPDSNETTLVAVKVLKEGVSNEARDDFEREVEIMSAFDHDNILKLIGTVSTGNNDTPYMVFEYMMHGDLAELLRKNEPTIKMADTSLILQKTDLVDITIQIANGMRYLTSQHFVHRDLATRNCLVGDGLIVKISDFGMSRDIYTCDYYKIGGSRMLPVRWMSPEAVKWGRFTTDSDIWAFGVVLWEIFSYGRQPYYGHTNEEVIKFLDEGILLQRPEECPSIVYHVMLQCWKLDPKERLAFDRIHKYLTEYSKQLHKSSKPASFDVVNEYEIPL